MVEKVSGVVVAVLLMSLTIPVVHADSTLILEDIRGDNDATVQIKGHMVRMSQNGQPDYMLFDSQRDMAIHVNANSKQYTEVDRASLTELAGSVGELKKKLAPQLAMLQEQLKSLPPEQRAMIEKQMGGMANLGAMESAPSEKITTIKRGKDRIAGFDCQRYDVMADGQRIAETCMATVANANMPKADFAALSAMMKFMRDMAENAQQLTAGMSGANLTIGDLEGVPVAMKDFRNGHEYELASVSKEPLDDKRFIEYKTFNKKSLPKMM
ncbi:MAG: DUF4412 domain-containing protein [Thiogranum sp.]|nr:DUF4412 domain-containing protein [Thiogranum sp.]